MFILMMQELVGSSLECTNFIITATLSRLLGAQVYKKMKGKLLYIDSDVDVDKQSGYC